MKRYDRKAFPQDKTKPKPNQERKTNMKKKSWRDHVGGRYLTREDFPQPEILRWIAAKEEETYPPDKEPVVKWVLYCKEHAKGMVCNETNSLFMFNLTGEENPEDWVGWAVEAFNDKTVRAPDGSYGGIRLREVPDDDETEQPSTPARSKAAHPHRAVKMSEATSDQLADELTAADIAALTR